MLRVNTFLLWPILALSIRVPVEIVIEELLATWTNNVFQASFQIQTHGEFPFPSRINMTLQSVGSFAI
jgi:hypothetical protein